MNLFFRRIEGKGSPILILHGLFGSSKNWLTNGKYLSSLGDVYLLDCRNHGESPHTQTHNLLDLVKDVKEFIEQQQIEHPILIGHSMGGLTAMLFSLLYPDIPSKLVVVDIAPKAYTLDFSKEIECLSMDVSHYNSRNEIDKKMETLLPDKFIRDFLQMNLEKLEKGYRWKINITAIKNSRDALNFFVEDGKKFLGDVLFIFGSKSKYNTEANKELISKYFCSYSIQTIAGADHYLHYTHSQEFLKITQEFIKH